MKTHLSNLFSIFGLFSFGQYVFLTAYCLLSQTVIQFFLSICFLLLIYLLQVYYLVQSSHILLTYCQEFCFSSSSSAFPLMTYCQEFCFSSSSAFPLTSLPPQPSTSMAGSMSALLACIRERGQNFSMVKLQLISLM